jgi:hypothetical protein
MICDRPDLTFITHPPTALESAMPSVGIQLTPIAFRPLYLIYALPLSVMPGW